MTIPKTLKILGRTVKVCTSPKMEGMAGEWKACDYVIDILQGQNTLDELDTLLHEVMHAILHCQGRENGAETEETYVRALATGLLMVLRQNPKFVVYLMQEVKGTK